jgi:hypothetical protein
LPVLFYIDIDFSLHNPALSCTPYCLRIEGAVKVV